MQTNHILTPKQIAILLLATLFFVTIFATTLIIVGGETLGLLSESLIILPALFFIWRLKMPFLKTFRLKSISFSLFMHSVIILFAVFVIGDALDRLMARYFPMPEQWLDSMRALLTWHSTGEAVILIFATVIMAGFAEEMLFRGLLQQTLEHYREPAQAIVLTAVLFAVAHFNPWTGLQILFLGAILGYMAWKSQSILPAIILHGGNNLLTVLLLNSPEEKIAWYAPDDNIKPVWIILALVIFIPILISFHNSCKNNGSY